MLVSGKRKRQVFSGEDTSMHNVPEKKAKEGQKEPVFAVVALEAMVQVVPPNILLHAARSCGGTALRCRAGCCLCCRSCSHGGELTAASRAVLQPHAVGNTPMDSLLGPTGGLH
jgi:hypothetical protein